MGNEMDTVQVLYSGRSLGTRLGMGKMVCLQM